MPEAHVFDYLDKPQNYPTAAVNVVYGDEPFLKRLALQRLRDSLVEPGTPFAAFEGAVAEWRDVIDELSTVSLFSSGGPRLVLIEEADPFVTRQRAALEQYVAKPRKTGALVLDVQSWPGNTRLYKQVAESGLQIECRPPEKDVRKRGVLDEARIVKWLVAWARRQHQARLEPAAAEQLLALVGPQFGLLDQELAKLALFVEPGGTITEQMVTDIVGGWRTKTVWQLLDSVADGNAGEALEQLDKLLQSGESPQALFGQISWSLRRFAAAARIYQHYERQRQRISLTEALKRAGFREWPKGSLQRAEDQLKQMGRERATQLYRWLLETDLALKGTHSHGERSRLAIERLFVRLARELAPKSAARGA